MPTSFIHRLFAVLLLSTLSFRAVAEPTAEKRLLYVTTPGIRADMNYGGSGILVFDINNGHRFVRRIATKALDSKGVPEAMKGVCASAVTKRLYYCTPTAMSCFDLLTDQLVWEQKYDSGCDRMSITPDGKTIYLPTFEKDWWHVVDAASGEELNKITPKSGAHNTVMAVDGKHVYLAGLKSKVLTIADTATRAASGTVGPFSGSIRPFTVNGASTFCYCCVNDLLGFEIGDLNTGKVVARVEVPGFTKGAVKRHGCPSHGIAMTPDESEIWVSDGHNSKVHVFDMTATPPKLIATIPVRDQPGWVTMSIDGKYAYPSSGEVVDVKTKKILTTLQDENGKDVASEKMLEIDFAGGEPIRTGDQFGRGMKR